MAPHDLPNDRELTTIPPLVAPISMADELLMLTTAAEKSLSGRMSRFREEEITIAMMGSCGEGIRCPLLPEEEIFTTVTDPPG